MAESPIEQVYNCNLKLFPLADGISTMNIATKLKLFAKRSLNSMGFDILRCRNNPRQTLCGLKSMAIRTIIDVGANTGQFARYIAPIFTDAQIYCFEPLPGPYALLQQWALNQHGRIQTYNVAIGDEEGQVDMYEHVAFSPSSSILATTELFRKKYPFARLQEKTPVKISALDTQLRASEMDKQILVKIDVQGYEDRVIRSGGEILANAAVCILEISFDQLYEGQANFVELVSLLDRLNFRYAGNLEQNYAEDGHVIYCDAVFVKHSDVTNTSMDTG